MNAFDAPGRPAPAAGGAPPAHQPPPGAGFMNAVRWALFAALLVLAVASVTGYLLAHRPKPAAREQAPRVV
ncbi:MAG TPA: hypothetical protein VI792_09100, partial [Candidatus Eisenbacteria bacterium]